MILHALHDLYARLQHEPAYCLAAPGFSLQKIGFKVVITSDGELVEFQDIRVADGKRMRPKQLLVPGGSKPSGSGINPGFLWDNTGYMLGFVPKGKSAQRIQLCFEAFRQRHLGLEQEIDTPAFGAVCAFLRKWTPEQAEDHAVLPTVSTYFGAFQIVGEPQFVHDDPTITHWWEATSVGGAAQDAVVGECLITGVHAPLAKTHKPQIKGVVGGKAEALLVSYDKTAYESLGLRQSLNAPVSEAAAFRYATALNALLDGPRRERHRVVVADTTVVFWTGRPSATEDVFAQFFRHGDMPQKDQEQAQDDALRKKLQRFCAALRTGNLANSELADSPPTTTFYILGLSPNAARISVRFFHCSTIAELWRNLRQHYDDMRIDGRRMGSARSDPEFPPMWLLLAQTARESKDVPAILTGGLLHAIINKTRFPRGLYAAVMRRVAIERDVNYLRACIIKGYLVRNNNMEISMSLDITRKETSYRLGRLFAALEKTQRDALGEKISATIRDRFYGAASATPGTVMPRLLRTYQHHLAKLDGGRKTNREKLVQEILADVENIPGHLNLTDQGLFALGYYQQTQDFYRPKNDNAGCD